MYRNLLWSVHWKRQNHCIIHTPQSYLAQPCRLSAARGTSLSVHAKLFTDMQIKEQNILLFVTKAVHLRFPNKRTLCTKNSVWTKCHTESVMLRIKWWRDIVLFLHQKCLAWETVGVTRGMHREWNHSAWSSVIYKRERLVRPLLAYLHC